MNGCTGGLGRARSVMEGVIAQPVGVALTSHRGSGIDGTHLVARALRDGEA
jgi:hypothetical protein